MVSFYIEWRTIMKQNILFAMVLSTLICSVSIGAALEGPSPENIPSDNTSNTAVIQSPKVSPKKRPDPLVFPADFGSGKASEEAVLDNTAAATFEDALSRIKHKASQLGIQGKELALRVFTKENAHLTYVYMKIGVERVTTFVVMIAVFSIESIKWLFDILNSLRVTLLTPKPQQKID